MATYIPNATQTTEPVESRTVESAALEFRTLKAFINDRLEDVQDTLDTEIVSRIAGDANLQAQNNNQDVRLSAVENALLSIGEGCLPGTIYVQRLSGTGTQTVFTLDVEPQSNNAVDIYIDGLYQNKDTFTVSGADVTFSDAPPTGTNNIEVQITGTTALGETDASLVTYYGSSTGTVVRTVQDKLREWVSVTDFYANGVSGALVDPTGVIDSTAGIQAAIDSLVSAGGGTVKIPPGHYKITSTINVGLPILSGFQFITTRTSELTDPIAAANTIAANVTANKSKKHVNIVFDPGAVLVAYWAPATDTPVLSYNLQQGSSPGHGRIVNPTIISSAMLTAGVYNRDAVTTPQTNNLIAIFAASGAKHIENVFVSGVEHGIVSFGGFWTRITDVYVWWAGGRCLDIAIGNALKVENLAFWYSANGLVFDGDSSEICGIHTEQVAQDITIYKADCSTFGPAYLEDVETADGTGTNAVTLGYVNNGIKITHCRFDRIRVGSMRPNKGAMRIWDVAHGILSGVRAYGKTVTRDNNSTLIYENVDFSPVVPDTKTVVAGGGATRWASNSPTGSQYVSYGPWLFNLVGIATGSIAAGASVNYDFTLPTSLDGVVTASAFASYISGGDARLTLTTRILFTTPKKVRLTFANTTAGAIDPGAANLCLAVVAGL